MKNILFITALLLSSAVIKAQTIVQAEYFIDSSDAGIGKNTFLTLTNPSADGNYDLNINLSGLSIGNHKLYIRTKDSDGNWSITTRRNVEVINTSTYVIAGAEYFFNTDPGAGSANPVTFDIPAADSSFSFKIPLDKIPTGTHTLYICARDSVNSNWSITQWQKDSVVTSSGVDSIWSHPATWSNNKVPDINTVVLLHHKVYVDITTAVCKSLTPYRNDAQCIVMTNMKVTITGHR
jgi:hypothetical protein